MGKGLKDVHIAFAGSHEYSDKIPQWVKAHGGTFSRDINEKVTHLVATETAMKKNVDAVQRAKGFGINIVTYDWLEDSLLSKPCRPLRVGPYLWRRIQKESNKKAEEKKDEGGRKRRHKKQKGAPDADEYLGEFGKGARAIVSDMEKLGHHLYVDETSGLAYTATLVRPYLCRARAFKETFFLGVYETDEAPHTYATFVKYSRVGASRKNILAPRGSTLVSALLIFEKFFKSKTGLDWEHRFADSKVPSSSTVSDGNPVMPEGGWFLFERPAGLLGSLKMDAEQKL